jgi:hypothetical protein
MRWRSRLGCNAGARKGSAGSSGLIKEGVVDTSPGNGDRRRRMRGTRWLEERFRDRGATLEEVEAAWGRMAERARAKLMNVDRMQP